MKIADIKKYINKRIKECDEKYEHHDRYYGLCLDHRDLSWELENIKDMLDELDNRPKAKWVATERHLYMCTNCESEFIETSEHNYCPYCGAKMEPYKRSEQNE